MIWKLFRCLMLVLVVVTANGQAWAKNWDLSESASNQNNELVAVEGKCQKTDSDCLLIDGISIRLSSKINAANSDAINFFTTSIEQDWDKCPVGYVLVSGAGMAVEEEKNKYIFITACRGANSSTLDKFKTSPGRIQFFSGQKCPSPREGFLWAGSIIGCL